MYLSKEPTATVAVAVGSLDKQIPFFNTSQLELNYLNC